LAVSEPIFVIEGARAVVTVVIVAFSIVGGFAVLLQLSSLYRRRDDAHLRALAERHLDFALRRAERDRFFAALLDEVRKPLGALQRDVDRFAELCQGCEKAGAVANAAREVDRLWHLSTRIASLVEAATSSETRVHADLTEAARAAIDRARPAASSRGVAIALDAPTPVPCRLSLESVRDAVAELLDNAARASIEGGHVELRVRAVGGLARIEVEDYGPGIPKEQQEVIFDPLARRARGEMGDGLGLAIARETARAHGGDVYIAPAENAGARVVLEIPAA
jgi:two-component system OmpR family sensor kinase